MASFSYKHRFDHDADTIFDIFTDFEAHREYLPLCKRSKVIGTPSSDGRTETANVRYVLAYQRYGFKKTLDLVAQSDFDAHTISLTGNNKDSKSVKMEFQVQPTTDGGCEVEATGSYGFTDLTMAVADKSGLLDKAFDKIMSAIDRQARQRHAD